VKRLLPIGSGFGSQSLSLSYTHTLKTLKQASFPSISSMWARMAFPSSYPPHSHTFDWNHSHDSRHGLSTTPRPNAFTFYELTFTSCDVRPTLVRHDIVTYRPVCPTASASILRPSHKGDTCDLIRRTYRAQKNPRWLFVELMTVSWLLQ
jgi:hypothetical protein